MNDHRTRSNGMRLKNICFSDTDVRHTAGLFEQAGVAGTKLHVHLSDRLSQQNQTALSQKEKLGKYISSSVLCRVALFCFVDNNNNNNNNNNNIMPERWKLIQAGADHHSIKFRNSSTA